MTHARNKATHCSSCGVELTKTNKEIASPITRATCLKRAWCKTCWVRIAENQNSEFDPTPGRIIRSAKSFS